MPNNNDNQGPTATPIWWVADSSVQLFYEDIEKLTRIHTGESLLEHLHVCRIYERPLVESISLKQPNSSYISNSKVEHQDWCHTIHNPLYKIAKVATR